MYCSKSFCCCYTHSIIQDGWTSLKTASFNGHQKVVELLLRSGANPDLQSKVSTWCTYSTDIVVVHVCLTFNETIQSIVNSPSYPFMTALLYQIYNGTRL